ncbi:hypothetical protein [Nitrosospira sp. Nsp13]|uniref:hypothetical protein n=1 Tax=Nitrosospira sp. Nsp13 TaxID=1855332 RepID=UPI00088B1DA0|nr:hypothetical protein [Nitrosospira sp. Nsp13]SCX77899.1 hypothetical protein SAMN05216308_101154 [Nitrosospira sp. Nsp13]
MRNDFHWGGTDHYAQFCEIDIEEASNELEDKLEVFDLLTSLDSFQSICNAGFFTDEPYSTEQNFITLTSWQYKLDKRWVLSRRIIDAGKYALFNLIHGYDTGKGPLLVVRMVQHAVSNDKQFDGFRQHGFGLVAKVKVPFELSGDPSMPLGRESIIRIEFKTALSDVDIDKWFSALRAWERIMFRQGFDDYPKAQLIFDNRIQLGLSELYMLSPNMIEYSCYGIEPSQQALTALLRFLSLQSYERDTIHSVELQP